MSSRESELNGYGILGDNSNPQLNKRIPKGTYYFRDRKYPISVEDLTVRELLAHIQHRYPDTTIDDVLSIIETGMATGAGAGAGARSLTRERRGILPKVNPNGSLSPGKEPSGVASKFMSTIPPPPGSSVDPLSWGERTQGYKEEPDPKFYGGARRTRRYRSRRTRRHRRTRSRRA